MKNKFVYPIYIVYICKVIAKYVCDEINLFFHYRETRRRGKTFRGYVFGDTCPNVLVMLEIKEIRHFRNSYEASEQFWATAQSEGIFAPVQIFVKLKFRDTHNPINRRSNPFNDRKLNDEFFNKVNVHADLSGGIIKRSDLQAIAKQIGYSENTLRINLGKLVHLGFVRRTKSGWIMISMRKAADLLGIELKRLRIKGETKEEVKDKFILSTIKRVIKKQSKVMHKTNSKVVGNLSCKYLANNTGYKSAMTISKRERKLEKKQRLIIERFAVVKTVLVDSFDNMTLIWKRPCNVLTPVNKAC